MEYTEKTVSTVDETLSEISLYEHIYVFGAGNFGKRIIKGLLKHGIKADSIIVTSSSENPAIIDGVSVCSVYDMERNIPGESLVIIGVSEAVRPAAVNALTETGFNRFLILSNPGILEGSLEKSTRNNMPVLEITSRMGCSIDCTYCPQKLLLKEYFKDNEEREVFLSLETFEKCVSNTPKDCVITFSGFALRLVLFL